MSEQELDLRRSVQIVRRHKIVVGILTALGALAGAGYAVHNPPMLTSNALVVLSPSTHDVPTQVVIASSNPVLSRALQTIKPTMSLQTLRSAVVVTRPTNNIISISVAGTSAAEAERTTKAVAESFVVFTGSKASPAGKVQAQLLGPVTNASGTRLPVRLITAGGLGALLGALIGVIVALAIGRGDRRLRQRDDIADAIGVPVLASLPVSHPSNPARWTRLLEDYEPSAADGWRLHNALHYLGLADVISANGSAGNSSLTILSLSSDRRALALGPQVAVFAASQGIPTALVIGPQQDSNTTAALRAACAAETPSSRRSSQLQLVTADHDNRVWLRHAALSIVVAVVDGQAPQVADMVRTRVTVLGVSAGAATAEQLARVAANAAADGRDLAGILVADPEPTDHTTGRVPQLTRPTRQRTPTRLTITTTETRR
jgi:capsular polysaccharide biosynthesis protein